jgi:hypothetical protein
MQQTRDDVDGAAWRDRIEHDIRGWRREVKGGEILVVEWADRVTPACGWMRPFARGV